MKGNPVYKVEIFERPGKIVLKTMIENQDGDECFMNHIEFKKDQDYLQLLVKINKIVIEEIRLAIEQIQGA